MKIWNYLLLGHLYLKLSYLQQVNLWKKTFIANSLRQIHQIVNTKHIKTVAYETLFQTFISSLSEIMKEEIYCQNIGANTPFQCQVSTWLSTETLLKSWPLIVPYKTKFSFTDNSKLLYYLANAFMYRPVVIYEL